MEALATSWRRDSSLSLSSYKISKIISRDSSGTRGWDLVLSYYRNHES